MDTRDYFTAVETVKAMMRRKMLYTLEVSYADEVLDLEDDETPMDFETFLERTIQDMMLYENYEGIAIIRDIKKEHGWR